MAVPIIDLKRAENDGHLLHELDEACRQHGFFILINHGMDEEISKMWQYSKNFFGREKADKRRLLRSESQPLGYYDRELTKRKRDLKEVFDFMLPRDEEDKINQWPEGDVAFKEAMLSFVHAADAVAVRTLDLIRKAISGDGAKASGLALGDINTSTARLNCYPFADLLSDAEGESIAPLGDMALHHHTDPGILTLLLQDMTGGLQAHSNTEGWIDVPPQEGAIVVNLGDVMQVWTNDKYKSAVHRVLSTTGSERYSTPFFYNPQRSAIIEPLPDFTKSNEKTLYSAFTWKEYIQGRIDDNYTDLGEDDIQIAKYKIASL